MRRFNVTVMLLAALYVPATASAQRPQSNSSDSGVVVGHLHSPDGTAAAGVRVMAAPVADSSQKNPSQVLEAITETDASGSYRLENLPPGRYYIRAGLVELPTYFPGTTTPGDGTAEDSVRQHFGNRGDPPAAVISRNSHHQSGQSRLP